MIFALLGLWEFPKSGAAVNGRTRGSVGVYIGGTQTRRPALGVPIRRIAVYWGLCWGPVFMKIFLVLRVASTDELWTLHGDSEETALTVHVNTVIFGTVKSSGYDRSANHYCVLLWYIYLEYV